MAVCAHPQAIQYVHVCVRLVNETGGVVVGVGEREGGGGGGRIGLVDFPGLLLCQGQPLAKFKVLAR